MRYGITMAFKPSDSETFALVFDLELPDSHPAFNEGHFIHFDDEDLNAGLFGFEMKVTAVTTRIPVSGAAPEVLLHGNVEGFDMFQRAEKFRERVQKFPGVGEVRLVRE